MARIIFHWGHALLRNLRNIIIFAHTVLFFFFKEEARRWHFSPFGAVLHLSHVVAASGDDGGEWRPDF